jgi:hypothetical protein
MQSGMAEWIPIESQLPPLNEKVLACCAPTSSGPYVCWWEGRRTVGTALAMEYGEDDGDFLPCTHWMPIPQIPEVN